MRQIVNAVDAWSNQRDALIFLVILLVWYFIDPWEGYITDWLKYKVTRLKRG